MQDLPVDADSFALLTGREITTDQFLAAAAVVKARARSYTRGAGFDAEGNPAEDIESVIMTAVIRLLANPLDVESERMGGFEVRYGAAFQGWSIGERETLNRYRVMAK